MASFLCLALLTLILFFSLTSAKPLHQHHLKTQSKISQACQATRYPETCITTLTQSPNLPSNPKPLQIIQYAVALSSQNLKIAQSMAKTILDSSDNANRTIAAENCLEVLYNSDYRLNTTADALPHGQMKDAMHWTSAALQYQYDCWSFLYFVNTTQLVNETMAFLISLNDLTSNALSMIRSYDLFGEKMVSWKPPVTERSGFWEDGGGSGLDFGFNGGFPVGLTPDVIVCKGNGMGCVKSVQEAVEMAPNNGGKSRFVIKIKEGVYAETVRIPLEKKNVVFLGDGMGKTVITGSLNKGLQNVDTYNSATVAVSGEGFMARDITFENTAGPGAQQAVAFRSESDRSILENCEFLGNQDTIFAHTLRQYYKSCRIEGNVDFIFGNSAAVFQDSAILVRPRQLNPTKGAKNVITAHGRTDPAQPSGFVFQSCVINGTGEYMGLYYSNPKVHSNFLGRPWKEYSRTVFIRCNLEALTAPDGWMPWSGEFALPTLYYGEYESSGSGANVSARVPWSNQIPKEHVSVYSVQNFIQGDEWIPTSSS